MSVVERRMSSLAHLSDTALVHEYRQGRDEAFHLLFSRYHDRLLGYLDGLTVGPAIVDDLTQETVLRVLMYGDSFDPDRPIWPWLATTARRVAISHWRSRSRREESFEDQFVSSEAKHARDGYIDPVTVKIKHPATVDSIAVRTEHRATLEPVLRQLSERHQVALSLRYLRDWSPERVAEHLDITYGACNALMARAREAARREHVRQVSADDVDPTPVAIAGGNTRLRKTVATTLTEHQMEPSLVEDLTVQPSIAGSPVVTVLLPGGPPATDLELWRTLRSRPGSATAVVLVDFFCSVHEFTVYRGIGIQGFVSANSPLTTLVEAVQAVAADDDYADPQVPAKPPDPYGLSGRQLEVLSGLKLFASNDEIAELLFVTDHTVKYHLAKICEKMNVTSREEIRYVALRDGLLRTPVQNRSKRTSSHADNESARVPPGHEQLGPCRGCGDHWMREIKRGRKSKTCPQCE